MGEDVDVDALLAQAKAAAEGRELWRKSGPVFAALIDAGVGYERIRELTGISSATAARKAGRARRERSARSNT